MIGILLKALLIIHLEKDLNHASATNGQTGLKIEFHSARCPAPQEEFLRESDARRNPSLGCPATSPSKAIVPAPQIPPGNAQ
ncbi:MAG: hypothetical protein [Microvirus sp.]|nr:MAG: hypothetical protein [Microvirus sp.]